MKHLNEIRDGNNKSQPIDHAICEGSNGKKVMIEKENKSLLEDTRDLHWLRLESPN